MTDLLHALLVIKKYNAMPLEDVVKEFERFTGQTIPEEAIKNARLAQHEAVTSYEKLTNVDFLSGGFLTIYGLKQL